MQARALYVGTSGWSYPSGPYSWRGGFYPRGFRGDELAYYAERFNAVEVNSSFYRVPSPAVVASWADRTPAGFRFAVKLFRKFTHPGFFEREEDMSPEVTEADVAAVKASLEPLAESAKLGALLIQYPGHFRRTEENAAAMVRTLSMFREYPLCVEIRHASWLTAATWQVLEHFGASMARIDEPFFQNWQTAQPTTGSQLYYRLHGRNEEMWREKDAGAARYDYLYTAADIKTLASVIDQQDGPGPVFSFFNNHPNSKAAANAIQLAAQLGLPVPGGKLSSLARQFPELQGIVGPPDGQFGLL